MEELLKSLIHIQQNLNAPKDQYNQFGKFKYRKLEDIQAAIKPLLAEQSCGIRFADEIVEHCGRTFLKTTLTFFNDKGETLSTTAEAEHPRKERYGCSTNQRSRLKLCKEVCHERPFLYRRFARHRQRALWADQDHKTNGCDLGIQDGPASGGTVRQEHRHQERYQCFERRECPALPLYGASAGSRIKPGNQGHVYPS